VLSANTMVLPHRCLSQDAMEKCQTDAFSLPAMKRAVVSVVQTAVVVILTAVVAAAIAVMLLALLLSRTQVS
jgi:predicted branched-subunit amino acid permease